MESVTPEDLGDDEFYDTCTQTLEQVIGAKREHGAQRAVGAARELGIEYTRADPASRTGRPGEGPSAPARHRRVKVAAVLDHIALASLYRADSFFTGLYIDASRGTGRVLIPSLSIVAAEREVAGAGKHAASLRFAESVPFTAEQCQGCDDLGRRGLACRPRGGGRMACDEGGGGADRPVAETRALCDYRDHPARSHLNTVRAKVRPVPSGRGVGMGMGKRKERKSPKRGGTGDINAEGSGIGGEP
jgi:hypothetical protein